MGSDLAFLSLVIFDRVAAVLRTAYQNEHCSPGLGAGASTSEKTTRFPKRKTGGLCYLGTKWHCLQGYYLYYFTEKERKQKIVSIPGALGWEFRSMDVIWVGNMGVCGMCTYFFGAHSFVDVTAIWMESSTKGGKNKRLESNNMHICGRVSSTCNFSWNNVLTML